MPQRKPSPHIILFRLALLGVEVDCTVNYPITLTGHRAVGKKTYTIKATRGGQTFLVTAPTLTQAALMIEKQLTEN